LKLDGFKEVTASDFLEGKKVKKSEMIEYIIKKEGLNAAKTIYVGDSETDIAASKINGIKCAAVLYGYGSEESIRKAMPKYLLDSFEDLKRIVFKENL
jgi:phosphoglycolate phosphatase